MVSHYEPSDFAGLPVWSTARPLAPPQARKGQLSRRSCRSCSSTSGRGARRRCRARSAITQGEVGRSLRAGDVRRGGQPRRVGARNSQPTANRCTSSDAARGLHRVLVRGSGRVSASTRAAARARQRSLVASFRDRIRAGQVSALPHARRLARPGPSPPRASGTTPRGCSRRRRRSGSARTPAARHGTVGEAVGHEFLAWTAADLPDPGDLLTRALRARRSRAVAARHAAGRARLPSSATTPPTAGRPR